MFLKKVTAVGFKSFADRVTIPFDMRINGIVGPNGSGKSNVIDAVRWVMGEQNAKNLRGKVATDIIFSGSANRKPMGMAEVTLVFDNSDESSFCPPEYRHEPEISLTRRLYIDGEREYLINKKPCRLKDIVSFFQTTGLGGRSYSMIQQGQVDRILNAKPEDVRIILEEAAGTLVYKQRRDDALKKFQQTDENLSRIEDILGELEKQKDVLQGQMEKAKSWKEWSAELRDLELRIFRFKYEDFSKLSSDLKGSTEKERQTFEALEVKLRDLEAREITLRNELDRSDPGLEGLRETVTSIREQIARAESIISSSDEKIETYLLRLKDIQGMIEQDNENLKELEERYDKQSLSLSQTKQELAEVTEQLEEFQLAMEDVDERARVFESKIEDFEDELINIDRQLETNKLRCENINRERSSLSDEQRSLEDKIQEAETSLTHAKKEFDLFDQKASGVREGLDKDISRRDELELKIQERRNSLRTNRVERDRIKEAYFTKKAKIESLEEWIETSSSVSKSLTQMREGSDESAALELGLLTDHIRFKENFTELSPRLRQALEVWTERLVVKSYNDLEEVLAIAKDTEARSFAVSIVPEARSQAERSKCEEWCGSYDARPLSEFVSFSGANQTILADLLSTIVIVDGIGLDPEVLKTVPSTLTVLTGAGLIASSAYHFSFVYQSETGGLLSKKNELERTLSEWKALQGELGAIQAKVDSDESMEVRFSSEFQELDHKLKNQNSEVLSILSEQNRLKQDKENCERRRLELRDRIAAVEARDRMLVEELSNHGQARISLADEQERIRIEIDELKEESQSVLDQKSEGFKSQESRRLSQAKLESRAQSLEDMVQQARTQLERSQSQMSSRYSEKNRIEDDITSVRKAHEESLENIQDLLVSRDELESQLAAKREENQGILVELREIEAKIRVDRADYNKLSRAITDTQLSMERINLAVQSLNEQCMEKYHLSLDAIDLSTLGALAEEFQLEDGTFDEKSSVRRVSSLKGKIEKLGAINMMAIDEYDSLMARYNFIASQREEVLNSKALLEDALEEIEETSKKKFEETYVAVNTEFQLLFPILFPGGEGKLDLSAPEDPLNSGVEIIVRLPGKKPQRMTLLSGGEKALTAISLIFALLKTKPTPFCFLDEVDAPLDEANVGRYNRVLEALADRFQFIVITHNRRTMEVLDTLFGVTMQEPGVSKVVGVDMKKDIPEHLKKAFKDETPQTSTDMSSRQGASAEA